MSLDLLRRGLKVPHLRLMAELARQSKLTDAASVLGITQPAASRLISEVARITDAEIYVRSGRGIELTDIGANLAERCVRILQEFQDAGQDIEQYKTGLRGHVSIGAVTGPAVEYVLPAIRHIRLSYPEISISVEIGTSKSLAPMLEDGRLDFTLSRVPVDLDPRQFDERPLLREPACMVARVDHPLTRIKSVIAPDLLLGFDWVLPPVGSPIRATAEQALRDRKLQLPTRILTTSSFLFTLITIQKTNAIGPVARSVAESFASGYEGAAGSIVILPVDFELSVETYSFLTRHGQSLTPVSRIVAKEVMRAVADKTN